MKAVSGKEFAKLLERKGWILKRIKGSHHYTWKQTTKACLLKYFMKIAGIDESEL